jgi:hypothetical protein
LVAIAAAGLLLAGGEPVVQPPGEVIELTSWHAARPGAFEIRASPAGQLYPGATRKLGLTIINPNPFPIEVRTIKGRLASTSRAGCQPIPANLEIRPYDGRLPLVVRGLSRRDAGQLAIHMPNTVVDGCQRARFVIHINSSATKADR